MKSIFLVITAALSVVSSFFIYAEENSVENEKNKIEEKKEAPNKEVSFERPFLGISTSPLPINKAGNGLRIAFIDAACAVSNLLQVNDILVKVDDQLIFNQDQLAQLIRQKKVGDEITLTWLREDKEHSGKTVLEKRPNPIQRMEDFMIDNTPPLIEQIRQAMDLQIQMMKEDPLLNHADFNNMIKKLDNGMIKGTTQFQKIEIGPDGIRSSSKKMIDADGVSYTYNRKNDKKTLIIEKDGKEIFNGLVITDVDWEKVPEEYRKKAQKMDQETENGNMGFIHIESIPFRDIGILRQQNNPQKENVEEGEKDKKIQILEAEEGEVE